ncbi:Gag-Pol polyprotein [Varanus komodoensis]|nr:Gag-Pol polyprotein [Varanus komodoensis]
MAYYRGNRAIAGNGYASWNVSPRFSGPDTQHLTAEMRARLMKGAPSHMRGPLLVLLGPAQGVTMAEIVMLIGQLGDIQKENAPKPCTCVTKEKEKPKADRKPFDIKVTRKQMFLELPEVGVPRNEIDGIPTGEMYKLWKQKCVGKGRKEVKKDSNSPQFPCMAAPIPDMVTLLESIEKNAGVWHAVIDLANVFFSILIDQDSQDQFAFTWEGRQYTFQVVPQDYVHSPILCHGIVARDLEQITLSPALFIAHYIDDILVSGPTEEEAQQGLTTVIEHMRSRGWEINPKKIQGPAQVQFLGVVWAGLVWHIPEKF